MYVKIFAQMYDGTLCTAGPWQALVTFQQLLILADTEGVVDMTAVAIHRRTTVPLDIIEKGLAALMLPDPDSRTPVEDGRRIVPVSEGRSWGWRVVNYEHYRKLKREEDRREYHRAYWHKRKGKQADPLNNTQHNSTDTTESTYSISRSICNKDQQLLDADAADDHLSQAEARADAAFQQLSDSLPLILTDSPAGEQDGSGTKPKGRRRRQGEPTGDALCDIVIGAYESILCAPERKGKCLKVSAPTPKRTRRIKEADAMARKFCEREGWEYSALDFWTKYFQECMQDPWARGDVANPNNADWKPHIDLLIDEKRFTKIMDQVVTRQ